MSVAKRGGCNYICCRTPFSPLQDREAIRDRFLEFAAIVVGVTVFGCLIWQTLVLRRRSRGQFEEFIGRARRGVRLRCLCGDVRFHRFIKFPNLLARTIDVGARLRAMTRQTLFLVALLVSLATQLTVQPFSLQNFRCARNKQSLSRAGLRTVQDLHRGGRPRCAGIAVDRDEEVVTARMSADSRSAGSSVFRSKRLFATRIRQPHSHHVSTSQPNQSDLERDLRFRAHGAATIQETMLCARASCLRCVRCDTDHYIDPGRSIDDASLLGSGTSARSCHLLRTGLCSRTADAAGA